MRELGAGGVGEETTPYIKALDYVAELDTGPACALWCIYRAQYVTASLNAKTLLDTLTRVSNCVHTCADTCSSHMQSPQL